MCVSVCVTYFHDKIPDKKQIKGEEGFNLFIVQRCSPNHEEEGKAAGHIFLPIGMHSGIRLSRPILRDPFPPMKLLLLKVSQPFKQHHQLGTKCSIIWNCGEHFISKVREDIFSHTKWIYMSFYIYAILSHQNSEMSETQWFIFNLDS